MGRPGSGDRRFQEKSADQLSGPKRERKADEPLTVLGNSERL
jgi:hypothetical protein